MEADKVDMVLKQTVLLEVVNKCYALVEFDPIF